MQYYKLRFDFPDKKELSRVVINLNNLRKYLNTTVPNKILEQDLLLGTWNIRDLGKQNRRGYGDRTLESYYYIAEVLSRFDFVAVQEVNELPEWKQIMSILGPNYDYIATDVTPDPLGGNQERLTYLWDKRKVSFQKIAGEIVLPPKLLVSKIDLETNDGTFQVGKQFRRTPFSASFQSAWFKFDICTVHIYYGTESGEKLKERIDEINSIASYLSNYSKEALKEGKTIILLGDFNIVHPEHQTMKALIENGFKVPKELFPTNIGKNKYYDQIAFLSKTNILKFIDTTTKIPKNKNAGVLDIFSSVFTEKQVKIYLAEAKKSTNGKKLKGKALDKYYLDWRTYQMSDHNLLWVRLQTDNSEKYLNKFILSEEIKSNSK